MNIKILAPAFAAALLAAPSAFAQSSTAPAVDCKTGDLNCPTPLNSDKEAPSAPAARRPKSAIRAAILRWARAASRTRASSSSQKEIKKEGATPMDGNSNK